MVVLQSSLTSLVECSTCAVQKQEAVAAKLLAMRSAAAAAAEDVARVAAQVQNLQAEVSSKKVTRRGMGLACNPLGWGVCGEPGRSKWLKSSIANGRHQFR